MHYQVTTVPLVGNSGNGVTAAVGCPPGTHVIGGGVTVTAICVVVGKPGSTFSSGTGSSVPSPPSYQPFG